ncbi:hypothetical protein [Vibrio nitrifigilis]|uniref:hypothetical protein n=1 Tax=Vibrio nitrifigilis TaxID=2789781 RepID=UPI001E59DF28|nr:hypothetical protein [Vibrio nitrifigilis]
MPYQNIVLVHAVRKQKELVYRDHIHQLQERYAGAFTLHTHCLTRKSRRSFKAAAFPHSLNLVF